MLTLTGCLTDNGLYRNGVNMKIVIDGFGGDNSPDEVLKGAALAVKELGIEVAVTGETDILRKRMEELNVSENGIELVPAEAKNVLLALFGKLLEFAAVGKVTRLRGYG